MKRARLDAGGLRWRRRAQGAWRLALLLGFAPASVAAPAPGGTRAFRAGAATSNVTPFLGGSMSGSRWDKISTNVHDELFARCLVLDNGATKLALVVVDSCKVPRDVGDAAKLLASEATGIPVTNILVSATHTHTAPTASATFSSTPDPGYKEFLTRRIADGIRRANHQLEPARIGWRRGREPSLVFNRRWFVKGGARNPFGGMDAVKSVNPSGYEIIKTAGPTDPDLNLISIRAVNGRPIAVLANYSMHHVGGTKAGDVSADYFGVFCDRVQELMQADRQDPPFVAMMSNGTAGNINNNDFISGRRQTKPPYEQLRFVARRLADVAIAVEKELAFKDWVELGAAQREIELGVRRPKPDELERARDILAKAKKFKPTDVRSYEEVYATETVDLEKYPASVALVLQAVRIGDLAITAVPCEVFVEIGLELKRRSPFGATFLISLANGYNGYLPTPEQHALGGYETWPAKSSYLEVEAAPRIIATLEELQRSLGPR